MSIEFTVGKCKTKATYSAKLKKSGKLNLAMIKNKFRVVLETPILLVVKTKAGEVIVHAHGELLFKKCEDLGLIEKVSGEIYGAGLEE